MPETFDMKTGNTSPSMKYILDLDEGQTLIGATARFIMVPDDGSATIDRVCVVDDAEPALIQNWLVGDTDTAGLFKSEFRVTYSDGTIETFPNGKREFIYVRISAGL